MKGKRITSIIATLLIVALVAGCGGSGSGSGSSSADNRKVVLGALSLLNMTEDEYLAVTKARVTANEYLEKQGVYTGRKVADYPEFSSLKFYDTLDAMIMAIDANEISSIELPECTATYVCAHKDTLEKVFSYNMDKADDFAKQLIARMGVGYSFMMKEGNTALRDEFDKAITAMKADGTLARLVKDYINEGIFSEQKEVKFENKYKETIKIAVTGCLPPMDYVSPDGKYAGFNTAICAEIGKRLGKNIELVQVDSMGRAVALSSGQVDAVFWTITANENNSVASKPSAERKAYVEELKKNGNEEQSKVMQALNNAESIEKRQNKDQPTGTIITQSYYSDSLIAITKKR